MAKKVLIIEHEKFFRNLLAKKLNEEGYEVTEADNGMEGLSMMNEFNPSLVLIEMDMPGFTGMDTIEEINKSSSLRHTPIIIISSPENTSALQSLSSWGVKDQVVKTEFDPRELVEKVAQQIKD